MTAAPASSGELELRAPSIVVRCRPEWGFVITAIEDPTTGVNALWTRRGHEPAAFVRSLGAPGEASVNPFLDRFIGGCFEMFPSAGLPGEVNGSSTFLHGEVAVLPWTVRSAGPTHVEASVATLRSPFHVTRRLDVGEDGLLVTATIANAVGSPRPTCGAFTRASTGAPSRAGGSTCGSPAPGCRLRRSTPPTPRSPSTGGSTGRTPSVPTARSRTSARSPTRPTAVTTTSA